MEEVRIFLVSPTFWMCALLIALILNIIFFLIVKRVESERYLRLLNFISTFFLVIVGLWYTSETRSLRIHSEKQLSVIRQQFQISNAPYLIPSIIPKDQVRQAIKENKLKQKTGKTAYTKEQLVEIVKYAVLLSNVSDKIAYDAHVYIFNSSTKSYMRSGLYKIYIAQGNPQTLLFFDESAAYVDENKLIEEMNNEFDLQLISLKDYILNRDRDTILLFFRDNLNTTYLCTRNFLYTDKDEIIYQNTEVYELH